MTKTKIPSPTVEREPIDWNALKALRARFLGERMGPLADYWDSDKILHDYDETFGARIAWKWAAVWREVYPYRALFADSTVWDWGCGTGRAGRSLFECLPAMTNPVWLTDRNASAVAFSRRKLQNLGVSFESSAPSNYLLLGSHVLSELDSRGQKSFESALENANAFILVEPGTPELSRKLISIRESLRGRFQFLAPCGHSAGCGMLDEKNARHWCHHFAEVPSVAFTDSFWRRFSQEMGIDLRSLPISYLVGVREALASFSDERVIGRPRIYRGFAKVLLCSPDGVSEQKILERHNPQLCKDLRTSKFTRRITPPANSPVK